MEHWISSRKFPGCQTERWEIQRFFSGVKRLAISVNGQCIFFFTKKFPLDLFYSILQILHRNNIQKKTLEIAMLSTCDNFGKIRERNALRLNLIWNFTHRTRVRFVQFFGKLFGVKIQP